MRSPRIIIAALIALLFVLPVHAQQNPGTPVVAVQSTTAESSHVLKTSSGFLYGLSVTTAGTPGYVLVFDLTSAPSGSVTPKLCYAVDASSTVSSSFVQYPLPFVNGIVVQFSSTGCFVSTPSATVFFSAQVK